MAAKFRFATDFQKYCLTYNFQKRGWIETTVDVRADGRSRVFLVVLLLLMLMCMLFFFINYRSISRKLLP